MTYQNCLGSSLLLIAAVGLIPAAAGAEEAAAPPGWKCESCPRDVGTSGKVEVGAGYVSDDSFHFGNYTGLEEKGAYFIGDGYLRYRDELGRYFDVRGWNLGLDSRSIEAQGGEQGKYELFLEYDQLPVFLLDERARTPFRNSGDELLLLPDNWVPAPNTQDMTELNTSLRPVTIGYDRDSFATGASFIPGRNWDVTLRYSHDKRDGKKDLGGSFLFSQASILPAPVEDETDQVEVVAAYTGKKLQGNLGYYGSFYNDKNTSLTWQNPYQNPSSPTGFGRLSLAPDNKAHQIKGTLGYSLPRNTRATALLAFGKMTQDDKFLPYTINPNLSDLNPLPRSSLDGEVETRVVDLRLASRPIAKLRWNAKYKFDERDNDTPQAEYNYIVTDLFPAQTPRTNLPYGHKRHLATVDAAYRLPKRSELSAGFDFDKMTREFQAVKTTKDRTFWGQLRLAPHDMVDVNLRYARSHRKASDPRLVDADAPPQNPVFRSFYLAPRDRNAAKLRVSIVPDPMWSLDLSADYAFDDYEDTVVGLVKARDFSTSAGITFILREDLSAHASYTYENIAYNQEGSAAFSIPDWRVRDKYRNHFFGAGVDWTPIKDRLKVGAEFVYSAFRGKINYDQAQDFPDLKNDLTRFRVFATYQFQENMSVKLDFLHQEFNGTDWAIRGVEPDSVDNVLSLGQGEGDYDVNVVGLSMIYDF